jgi:hypothetical protein
VTQVNLVHKVWKKFVGRVLAPADAKSDHDIARAANLSLSHNQVAQVE